MDTTLLGGHHPLTYRESSQQEPDVKVMRLWVPVVPLWSSKLTFLNRGHSVVLHLFMPNVHVNEPINPSRCGTGDAGRVGVPPVITILAQHTSSSSDFPIETMLIFKSD